MTDSSKENIPIVWRSPSNIALVKYWGKRDEQIPQNPSVSFTLSSAFTETQLSYSPKSLEENNVQFYFEGEDAPAFAERVKKVLSRYSQDHPVLLDYDFTIRSRNSFPHSAGIASSAASMSALALCITELLTKIDSGKKELDFQHASHLARLASGSACRSVYGGLVAWGNHPSYIGSSNEYAVSVNEGIDPIFSSYRDTILLVEAGVKSVSSSAGHGIMNTHKWAQHRFDLATENNGKILGAMKEGDVSTFQEVIEEEAFSIHSMMLTGQPSYILMKPNTLAIIDAIRTFRKETGCNICFTLDAGPNVHVLYPENESERVRSFIEDQLLQYCVGQKAIWDQVGEGPVRLKSEDELQLGA